MKPARPGESGLIRSLARRAPAFLPSLRVGIGDDASVWRPTSGCETLSTCDQLVEGVHFSLKTTTPWALGAKALAVNLSDIAAMGGTPRYYLVSLAIPKSRRFKQDFFEALYDGMHAWGTSFGASLAGGNITSTPGPLSIDIFLVGECAAGRALLRSGARSGDYLFCTGSLGDSAAGLASLRSAGRRVPLEAKLILLKKHHTPQPRFLAGCWLSDRRAASACIDVSDGLSTDLARLAEASGVGFEVEAEKIPLSPALRAAAAALRHDPLDWALNGGEDYELLFTAPPAKLKVLQSMQKETGTSIRLVGRALPKARGIKLLRAGRRNPLKPGGWDHLSR